jgi:hypothetical protein
VSCACSECVLHPSLTSGMIESSEWAAECQRHTAIHARTRHQRLSLSSSPWTHLLSPGVSTSPRLRLRGSKASQLLSALMWRSAGTHSSEQAATYPPRPTSHPRRLTPTRALLFPPRLHRRASRTGDPPRRRGEVRSDKCPRGGPRGSLRGGPRGGPPLRGRAPARAVAPRRGTRGERGTRRTPMPPASR